MSEYPPPYPPAPTPRRKNNTTIILVVVLVMFALICLGTIGLLFGGGYFMFRQVAPMVSCTVAFQEVHQALLDFAKDNEGRLPEASGWQDAVSPYYAKSVGSEGMPFERMQADGEWGCKISGGMTGMAFNSELSNVRLEEIKDHDSTILLFEIENARRNANEPYKQRPKETSPTIFGEARDWIKVPVSGNLSMSGASSRRRTLE